MTVVISYAIQLRAFIDEDLRKQRKAIMHEPMQVMRCCRCGDGFMRGCG